MLTRLRQLAQARATADSVAIAQRFHRADRARLQRFASRSLAHGDIALQFPMLAFMLAGRHLAAARRQAAELAIAEGATLARVARVAGVPMWTRALPPLACMSPQGCLPSSPDFACRISDILRKRSAADRDSRGLVRAIARLHAAAGEELALWFAAHYPEGCLDAELAAPVRLLVLWYLFSKGGPSLGRDLIHTRWSRELSLETALRSVKNFARRIDLELMIGPDGLADPWYARASLMDLDFVPLTTSTEIRAEALRNHNCVDWYGQRLATNEVRLWSVRKADGTCVANVEVSASERYPTVPRIAQIKAPNNGSADAFVTSVAEIWLRRQVRTHGAPDMRRCKPPQPDSARWHSIVAPLAERGVLPVWAQTCPTNRDLAQLEVEFTVLGCRLQARGWRFA